MTTNKPTPLYGPNGTVAYNADGLKAMTTNKPEAVTMGDRYPESECYQCGRLKTALSYRSRCLTCETQRADANADENDELRTQLSDYEALQAECDALRAKSGLSLGVGDGTGNLFVHGDYDSIKCVQELIFKYEKLCKDVEVLVEALEAVVVYDESVDDNYEDTIKGVRVALATYHKQGGKL
jgi:hypothetical protein